MVIKLPRSRESTPVAVTPPSTSLELPKAQNDGLTGTSRVCVLRPPGESCVYGRRDSCRDVVVSI